VVEAASLPFHGVLIVADIFSVAVPADTSGTGGLFTGIEEGLLALIIRAVGLNQINDVELIADILAGIRHSKVEPLSVCGRLVVVFQDEVVGVVAHINCSP